MVLHVNHVPTDVKTNVTLKLDADLLREARVVAAEEGRSISGLLTDRLEAIVRERKAFDKGAAPRPRARPGRPGPSMFRMKKLGIMRPPVSAEASA